MHIKWSGVYERLHNSYLFLLVFIHDILTGKSDLPVELKLRNVEIEVKDK